MALTSLSLLQGVFSGKNESQPKLTSPPTTPLMQKPLRQKQLHFKSFLRNDDTSLFRK